MKLKSILSAFAATMLIGGAASAATIGWSEGQREQVVGTQVITPTDASNAPPGFFLGSVRGGETIDLHGRIVKSSDFFTFTAKRAFSIEFIFGGYAEVGGPGSAVSGLTAVPVGDPGSSVDFFLDGVASAGNTYNTDITGGNAEIFGTTVAGTYELEVDGINIEDALYDIRINVATVPVPAGGLLLLTALGGLAAARRKRS